MVHWQRSRLGCERYLVRSQLKGVKFSLQSFELRTLSVQKGRHTAVFQNFCGIHGAAGSKQVALPLIITQHYHQIAYPETSSGPSASTIMRYNRSDMSSLCEARQFHVVCCQTKAQSGERPRQGPGLMNRRIGQKLGSRTTLLHVNSKASMRVLNLYLSIKQQSFKDFRALRRNVHPQGKQRSPMTTINKENKSGPRVYIYKKSHLQFAVCRLAGLPHSPADEWAQPTQCHGEVETVGFEP